MKIWDKGYSINDKIENFTIGKDRIYDVYLAQYDTLATKAHMNMLHKVGLIDQQEAKDLELALDDFFELTQQSDFLIEDEFEDIHSKLEMYLIEKCGDAGKKIHTARSRNDQVLVAIQLFLKDYLKKVNHKTLALIDIFSSKATEFQHHLLPGYTHFQAAMPSSFGLWFSAYAENLLLSLTFVEAAYEYADQNPLGSAAGYGTSFPIDRLQTTDELKFGNLLVSAVSAQMLRGATEKATANAAGTIAGVLSKMAYDLVMYNSQDMGFVELPKEMTTGSSIMPHKKNPDVFELTRAQCNKIQGVSNNLALMTVNLPSGYHRDFQLLKEVLFEPLIQFLDILDILIFAIPQIKIKEGFMDQTKFDTIYTVETINKMIQDGTPFRDAYKIVGQNVDQGKYKATKDFKTTHIGSVHNPGFDILDEKINQFKENSKVLNSDFFVK